MAKPPSTFPKAYPEPKASEFNHQPLSHRAAKGDDQSDVLPAIPVQMGKQNESVSATCWLLWHEVYTSCPARMHAFAPNHSVFVCVFQLLKHIVFVMCRFVFTYIKKGSEYQLFQQNSLSGYTTHTQTL